MSATTTSVVEDRARWLLELQRDAKDRDFAEHGAEGSTPIVLVPWRGLEQVALVLLTGDRTSTLQAMRSVGAGFTPDCLGVVFEGYFVVEPQGRGMVNPDTGRRWDARAHDMSAYIERHGRQNGLVYEGVSAMVRNAAGDLAWLQQPFTVTANRVHWSEIDVALVDDSGREDGPTGSFLDVLRHGIGWAGRTSPFRAMVAERYNVSDETVTAATDALASVSLQGAGVTGTILLQTTDEQVERRRVISEITGQVWSATVEEAVEQDARRRGRS